MSSWPDIVMTWGWMPSEWDISNADSFSRGDFLRVLSLPQLEPQDTERLLGLVTQSSLFPWASPLGIALLLQADSWVGSFMKGL